MKANHLEVKQALDQLSNDELITLGTALGLHYNHLKRMQKPLDEMVASWLKEEDDVCTVSSPPSWASLVKALRNTSHEGIARGIEREKLAMK